MGRIILVRQLISSERGVHTVFQYSIVFELPKTQSSRSLAFDIRRRYYGRMQHFCLDCGILHRDGAGSTVCKRQSSKDHEVRFPLCLSSKIAVTNYNRERIMRNTISSSYCSAYYGAPVSVQVLKCEPVGPMAFDREVNLLVDGKVFCTAVGKIELFSDICKTAIEEKNVGVGQLFRFLGVLPSFKLLSSGRNPDGALWRDYDLSCPQIRCRFVETFAPGFLDYSIDTLSLSTGASAIVVPLSPSIVMPESSLTQGDAWHGHFPVPPPLTELLWHQSTRLQVECAMIWGISYIVHQSAALTAVSLTRRLLLSVVSFSIELNLRTD